MFSSARTLAILLAIGTAGLTSACGMKGSLALPPPEQRTPAVLDRLNPPQTGAMATKAKDASTDATPPAQKANAPHSAPETTR